MNSKAQKILSQSIVLTMMVALLSGRAPSVYAAPGDLARVSVDSGGAQANGGSNHDQISGDGRYVVFESAATNLAGGTCGLFLQNRQDRAETPAGVDWGNAASSQGGRLLALWSSATADVHP